MPGIQNLEDALKQANEFINGGKKEEALTTLQAVIKSKKHQTLQKIHEPILRKYLELCVDLKQSHEAKEGLYQYKLISQQKNVASLENVVRYFLHLSEKRADDAQKESLEKIDVDDLEQIQTPESVLLSYVSAEVLQDRVDRSVVTPWVKFLWETYHKVLELLRNNARVEKLYHETAQRAFKFCLKWSRNPGPRKTEFCKLCKNLRNHLSLIMRHQGQTNAVDLSNQHSIQMHLGTRLAQLDSAITMELWQEAVKTVEDIFNLMQQSKKSFKLQLPANYYQKTALVFWKAKNYLFHAAALQRLFVLYREQKKTMTSEKLQKVASRLLVAVLSIPLPVPQTKSDKYLMFDNVAREKTRRLAALFSLPTVPTRATLVTDLVKLNVLEHAIPEIKSLYQWLEVDFSPLKLCKNIDGVTGILKKNEDLESYIAPLQEISLAKLLNQISQVYRSITITKLLNLAPFTDKFQLEKVIVEAAKRNNLQVFIDHRSNCVTFGSDLSVDQKEEVMDGPLIQSLPSEMIRTQLIVMAQALHRSVEILQPPELVMERAKTLENALSAYEHSAQREHQEKLKRKQVIEKRKEYLENLTIKKEMTLVAQATMRETERKQRELQEIERKQPMGKIMTPKKTTVGARALENLTEQEKEEQKQVGNRKRKAEAADLQRPVAQTTMREPERKQRELQEIERKQAMGKAMTPKKTTVGTCAFKNLTEQEKEEQKQVDNRKRKAEAAYSQRPVAQATMRETERKQRELQEIERKQAMENIMTPKKTTVGARALKNLTEQEKEEQKQVGNRKRKAEAADLQRPVAQTTMREPERKQRELQEIERKQAMWKIMTPKKTTVGDRALKNLAEQEKKEQKQIDNQKRKAKATDLQRPVAQATMRETERKQRDLQEVERKQAMGKIMAPKKTNVGARALKNLTEQKIGEMDADNIMAKQVKQLNPKKRDIPMKQKLQEKRAKEGQEQIDKQLDRKKRDMPMKQNLQEKRKKEEKKQIDKRKKQAKAAELQRLMRETERKQRELQKLELQKLERKHAMEKFMALRKTTFRSSASKNLTKQDIEKIDAGYIMAKQIKQLDRVRIKIPRKQKLQKEREKEEQKKIEKQTKMAMAAELKRVAAEATVTETKRKQCELQEIGKLGSWKEIEEMDAYDIMTKEVEQLDREKRDMSMKQKLQEELVDYFERAKRLEEIPLLQKQFEEFVIADKEYWDEEQEKQVQTALRERETALATWERLLRIVDDRHKFLEKLSEKRRNSFEGKMEKFNEELNVARKERLENRRMDRIRERKAKYKN